LLVAVCLLSAVVIAGRYPIHIRYHTKVSITSIPLYLLAVLLQPPLAALIAALGILLMELSLHAQRGNYPSDIATSVARSLLVILFGATVLQLFVGNHSPYMLTLTVAGLVILVSDLLLAPLELMPMTGEPFGQALVAVVTEGWLIEGVQYLLGMLIVVVVGISPWFLSLVLLPLGFVYASFKRAKELQSGTRLMVEAMADAVDQRDAYTGGHSRRVTELCELILTELNLAGPEVELILTAARVHDIGKIGIPDAILLKPARLTLEEEALMRTHASEGAHLLVRYPDFRRGVDVVRHHHERWDGQGYPAKLSAHAIPFGARVIAVADSFDAMTSDRPYAKGRTVATALEILQAGRGQQWDAGIVDAFVRGFTRAQGAGRTGMADEYRERAVVGNTSGLSSTR
ncbi:MAG: hypothetical protein AVDCRST_MAG93-6510, partial [uncultured Chloroflexia bacterium]